MRENYYWQHPDDTSSPTMEYKTRTGSIVTVTLGTMSPLEQIFRRMFIFSPLEIQK